MQDFFDPKKTGWLKWSIPYITKLIKGMYELDYQDEELWDKVIGYVEEKHKIPSTLSFITIWECLNSLNQDPKSCKYNKLDAMLANYKKTHYHEDRQWRYSCEEMRRYDIRELIAKREDAVESNYLNRCLATVGREEKSIKGGSSTSMERAKRLQMAKHSEDIFDELVSELLKKKKNLTQICAELECDEMDI